MNVEIGAEAAQFPEKEYINGIAVAVYSYIPLICYTYTFIQYIPTHTNKVCNCQC
jgi:hypothetical protein